jgi:hypothetical protein
MEIYFSDVKIVGIEDEMTYRPQTKLYKLKLKLSVSPPTDWIRFFDQSRKEPRHPLWRIATVERKHINVECVPEEMQTYLLESLKEDVAIANLRYAAFLRKELEEEMRIRGVDANDAQRLADLKGKLKFD